MSSAVRARFAPSPTGRLHLGNARTALVNWLFARAHGGTFLLRLDDTDAERSTETAAQAIETDLTWLGLDWDAFARQSDRMDRYEAALARLAAGGHAYRCYETGDELALRRKAQLGAGRPPIYDRAGLALDDAQRAALEAEGRPPYWRLKLAPGPIAWHDLVRGDVAFEATNLSDPVLVRADGRPLYTLSSVVDDAELGVSHVIRGEDHVANTAVQIRLFEALGPKPPTFAHLPLLAGGAGEGLSKREGAASLGDLRDDGIEAPAVAAYLARLGTGRPMEPADLGALVEEFDIAAFGRATPKVNAVELRSLSAKTLHAAPFDAVAGRLRELGLDGADDAFWLAVRPNLERLAYAADWHAIVAGPVTPAAGDKEFYDIAADLLPPEPWDAATWGAWTGAVRDATGRKGRELFLPLRRALTGRDTGPELKALLPLIGRARTLARLKGGAA